MQASLFTDYFVQCVGVHNITTDFISGENSLEVRNIFITKTMIKNVINLPIKYKINFNNKNNLVLKPLLKSVFMKYFNKNLIFKKQGFSGFPNESTDFLNNNEKKEIEILKKLFKKKIKINRAIEWKLINCFYFQKFCNKRLKLTNFF